MSRFTVPIKNILGRAYNRYRLTSSHYNTSSSTEITITCYMYSVFGSPIKNQLIYLYHQNESYASTYTDNNGIATWTINNLEAGLHSFRAGDATIFVNIRGWKTVPLDSGSSYGTLYVNESIRMCELRYEQQFSSAVADTFYTWHYGAVPLDYRPTSQVGGAMNQVGTLYVNVDGDIGGKFANSFSSSRWAIGTVTWHY